MSKDIIQFARALDFAARKHVHQRRKGELEEPYINHLAEAVNHRGNAGHVGQGWRDEYAQGDGESALGYSVPWLGEKE